MTQDMLLAMPSVLPLNCTAGDPVERVTAHSQSHPHTRPSERLSCLYEVHMNRKRFLEEKKKKKEHFKRTNKQPLLWHGKSKCYCLLLAACEILMITLSRNWNNSDATRGNSAQRQNKQDRVRLLHLLLHL